MWYTESDYDTIPAHSRSFSVALANLITNTYEQDVEPSDIYAALSTDGMGLDLHNFTDYGDVYKHELHDNEGSWPEEGPSIIKFIRTDLDTGERTGHYCYVLDHDEKTIIDSFDGVAKEGSAYGHVYTWATFSQKEPVPEEKFKWTKGSFHVWNRGDSLVDIARDMGVPYKLLLQANEIESYTELEDGVPIYYPAAPDTKSRRIEVEVQDPVLYMHVAKSGGAKKWMFGSIETFEDAIPAGFFPEHTNVIISAIAKVPVKDDENENATAAYYLDNNALGEYKTSGILRYTLGFAWSDLEHGHVETMTRKTVVAPEPVPLHTIEQIDEEEPETLPAPPERFTRHYIDEIIRGYQKLKEPIMCIVELPNDDEAVQFDPQTGKRFIWVKDYAGKRQDLPLYDLEDKEIGATFPSDGITYGQPVESMEANVFFGIPMSLLRSHDDFFLYNKPVDATTRANSGGQLTWSERYIWVPTAAFLSRFAPRYLRKINRKDQKS